MDNMMDTEPGGEGTQYEQIKTVTKPPAKQSGQMGAASENTNETEQDKQGSVSNERGEKTAENIRYGQSISEQGFGGKTTTSSGEAQDSGYGGAKADKDQEDLQNTRREQGYGGGSGVGA